MKTAIIAATLADVQESGWLENAEPDTCLRCGADFSGNGTSDYCDTCVAERGDSHV